MNRCPVESSVIESIGYDEVSETLQVEFKGGAIYHYYNVKKEIFEKLKSASSHGSYFNREIKDKYRFEKIK